MLWEPESYATFAINLLGSKSDRADNLSIRSYLLCKCEEVPKICFVSYPLL